LNSAVTPWLSLYAASMIAGSFRRSAPRRKLSARTHGARDVGEKLARAVRVEVADRAAEERDERRLRKRRVERERLGDVADHRLDA
jgi:hypothetical protein